MNYKKTLLILFLLKSLNTTAQKHIFFLIGPPTSGKTSIAKQCAKQFGWHYLSTETLCNNLSLKKTKTAIQIKQFVDTNKLVPDKIIIPLVNEQFEHALQTNNTIILESFPRTIEQAEKLLIFCKNRNKNVTFTVIRMHASDKTIHDRIQNRYICTKCHASYIFTKNSPLVPKKHMTCDKCNSPLSRKTDDKNNPIQKRIDIFKSYEKLLLDFYRKKKMQILEFTIELNTNNPLEKQFEKILKKIENI